MDGNGGIVGVKNSGKGGRWRARDVFLDRNLIRTRDITAGLVNRWKLTTDANDYVGGLPLTNNGTVTFGASGATLNGTDQWLSCEKTWPTTFTVTFWAKWSAALSSRAVVAASNNTGGNSFFVDMSSDVFLGANGGSQKVQSGRDLSDNALHFFAITGYASGTNTWELWIDGAVEGTVSTTFTVDTHFSLGRLGAYNGFYAAASVLDVRIYNAALSAVDKTALNAVGPNPT